MTAMSTNRVANPADPLGRLAAHAAVPYPAPQVGFGEMTTYWRDHYLGEFAGLSIADIRRERDLAAAMKQEHYDNDSRWCRLTGLIEAANRLLAEKGV